jgi:hypothetical protein
LTPQIEWLKQDLAASKELWKIVIFYHPPYTKGNHNSDTEPELVSTRRFLVPILERLGVDMVICGHSHVYERSRPIHGHYGNSASFDPAVHNLQPGGGTYSSDTSCAYVTSSARRINGVIYAVVGSSGQATASPVPGYPHRAMYYSNHQLPGCMLLNVNQNMLTAKWLGADTVVYDSFTVFKNVDRFQSKLSAFSSPVSLSASWPGHYPWTNGDTTQSIRYTSYQREEQVLVTDKFRCIADTFSLFANQFKIGGDRQKSLNKAIFLMHDQQVVFQNEEKTPLHVNVYSVDGRLLNCGQYSQDFNIPVPRKSGAYRVHIYGSGVDWQTHIMVE